MTKIIPATTLGGTTQPYGGNGRGFGYPTANISVRTELEDGVYFGFASLGEYQQHPALIFIGKPTTVGVNTHRVEAHLIDIADEDHYGEQLELVIRHFHRPNQHFGSIKELIDAMKSDELAGRVWFKTVRAQLSAKTVGSM